MRVSSGKTLPVLQLQKLYDSSNVATELMKLRKLHAASIEQPFELASPPLNICEASTTVI